MSPAATPSPAPSAAPPSPGQPPMMLPLLDLFRASLAVLVTIGHSGTNRVHPPSGAIWVDFFMMLSGFLMVHHAFLREKKEPIGTWKMTRIFWTRRFFRIAPLYYALFIVSLIFFWPFMSSSPRWSVGWTIFNHFTFLFGFIPDGGGPTMMPDWSIGLEMQFYLAFPLLVWALVKWGPMVMIGLGFSLTLLGKLLFGIYVFDQPGVLGHFLQATFLPLRLLHFVAGMVIAWLWWRKEGETGAWAWCGLALLVGVCAYEQNHSFASLGTVALACLLRGIGPVRSLVDGVIAPLNRLADSGFWRVAADFSYGIYLIHGMVIHWMRPPIYALGLGKWPEFAALSASVVLVSIALTALFHWTVEKPGIALGKRFLR